MILTSAPEGQAVESVKGPTQDLDYGEWTELVERIRHGESDGMEDLYRIFSRGIRFYIRRRLGPQDSDDKVHDIFVMVVRAILRDELRDSRRLMGFVRTIMRRAVAAHIDYAIRVRKDQIDVASTDWIGASSGNPEEAAIVSQQTSFALGILSKLPDREREILNRFYLQEQGVDEICLVMSLTKTQFRLLKSRAKARFGGLGKDKLCRRSRLRFAEPLR